MRREGTGSALSPFMSSLLSLFSFFALHNLPSRRKREKKEEEEEEARERGGGSPRRVLRLRLRLQKAALSLSERGGRWRRKEGRRIIITPWKRRRRPSSLYPPVEGEREIPQVSLSHIDVKEVEAEDKSELGGTLSSSYFLFFRLSSGECSTFSAATQVRKEGIGIDDDDEGCWGSRRVSSDDESVLSLFSHFPSGLKIIFGCCFPLGHRRQGTMKVSSDRVCRSRSTKGVFHIHGASFSALPFHFWEIVRRSTLSPFLPPFSGKSVGSWEKVGGSRA